MEPVTSETPNQQNGGANIIFVGMAVLYGLICLCLGVIVFIYRQQIPGFQAYSPSETAATTVTPVPHKPDASDKVFKDDFTENTQQWKDEWNEADVEVKNGHLSLISRGATATAMTKCAVCMFPHNHFYIEADFSTDLATDQGYGFAFNLQGAYNFYMFLINPSQERYLLYKTYFNVNSQSDSSWMLRLSKKSRLIKPYPQVNKLGVFFEKDRMELYINGQMVDTYEDPGTELTFGKFGFYTNGGGFEVIGDNLFSYSK